MEILQLITKGLASVTPDVLFRRNVAVVLLFDGGAMPFCVCAVWQRVSVF